MTPVKNSTGLPEFDENAPMVANPFTPSITIPDPNKEDPRPNAAARIEINKKADQISTMDKVEDKIARDIQSAQNKNANAPADPKDTLKRIIANGVHKEVIEALGVKWTMRALDQGDIMLAYGEVTDDMNTLIGRMSALEFMKVVYSIEEIDGVDIYTVFSDDVSIKDYPNNKVAYILAVKRVLQRYLEGFPPTVIDILYEAYQKVEQIRNEAVAALKNL